MIEVVLADEGWTAVLGDVEAFAERCHSAAKSLEPALSGEIALLFANDEALSALNSRYREKSGPTNVLSFPSGDSEGFLGDIAVARETCEREAAEKGVALQDHAAHLIIHGLLHLVGYDHENDEDAAVMERRETAILAIIGIADPYAGAGEEE